MSYSLGAGNLDVDTWSTITSGMSTEFFRNFDNVISEIERRYPFLKRRIVLTLGSQRNLSSLDNPFPVSADRATGNTHFLIGDSNGRLQVTPGISDQPFRVANRTAGAVAPTIAHVAPAGRRALLTGGTVFVACGATAQPAVAATLVDSADGEVWAGALAAAVNGAWFLDIPPGIFSSVAGTLTLSFAAAPVANTISGVSFTGLDCFP